MLDMRVLFLVFRGDMASHKSICAAHRYGLEGHGYRVYAYGIRGRFEILWEYRVHSPAHMHSRSRVSPTRNCDHAIAHIMRQTDSGRGHVNYQISHRHRNGGVGKSLGGILMWRAMEESPEPSL